MKEQVKMSASRKQGSKSSRQERTQAIEATPAEAAAAAGVAEGRLTEDALTVLQRLYQDENQSVALRVKAAMSALPYEKPRLASIPPEQSRSDTSHQDARRTELLEKLKGTMALLRKKHEAAENKGEAAD